MIKWRATFIDTDTPDMQITFTFSAPEFNSKFNYKQLAKLAFIRAITSSKQIEVINVEPIET
jgi:hypothetical protein